MSDKEDDDHGEHGKVQKGKSKLSRDAGRNPQLGIPPLVAG